MIPEKIRAPRPPQKKKRAYSPRESAKQQLKLPSLIKADEFCFRCQERIPTARLFALRTKEPDEKQRHCEDCAKEIERDKPAFR